MNLFTKSESKTIFIIFIALTFAIVFNMAISLRRGRDSVRKNDISAIQKLLDSYDQKYEIYPLSTDDGRIVGCFDKDIIRADITGYPTNAIPCTWGGSNFENSNLMPRDPLFLKNGASYRYISKDGKSYELYISLEGEDEAEYTQATVDKSLQCGSQICNYGRRVN